MARRACDRHGNPRPTEGRHIATQPSRGPFSGRPWSWITGRPRLTDAVVMAVTFVTGSLSLLAPNYRRAGVPELSLFIGLVCVQAGILFWRRSRPVAVLLASVAVSIAAFVISPDREPGSPALVFAVYAVSVYGPPRIRMWTVGVAIAMVIGAVALIILGDTETSRKFIPAGASSLVAWVIGDYVRSRRRFFSELAAQHNRDREEAAEAERLRIARELHDVVAHNVSVMAIQAGAARISGSPAPLEAIEGVARETLAELNRLLGVLRKDSASTSALRSPQPGLEQVDTLLKPARDAGLEVTMKTTGEVRPLPAAVDLSAYRIIQESITNTLKHAQASRMELLVEYRPDLLALSISDNGTGDAEGDKMSTGHGLIGMKERVEMLGGELKTGSSSLGGFSVSAKLPTG